MIQPGQKLKEGDYFRLHKMNLENQVSELKHISKSPFNGFDTYKQTGVVVCVETSIGKILSSHGRIVTEYNFADFKQLCENTFKQ